MENNEKVVRTMDDVKKVFVMVNFEDTSGYAVPLTEFQTAIVFDMLGFKMNEKGEIVHATDEEIMKKYGEKK